MKKYVASATAGLLLLTLTGCTSGLESKAVESCKDDVRARSGAESVSFSDVEVENVLDSLYESGAVETRDSSRAEFQMFATATYQSAGKEARHDVSCYVIMENGKVSKKSLKGI